jgi:phage terminase large subunit-like protein
LTEYLHDPETGEPYNATTFSLDEYLEGIDPRLLKTSDGRRALTRLDPLAFGLLYLPHHMKGKQTGEQITFADCHLDWARRARQWVRPVTEPRSARDVFISPRESAKSTWWFLIIPMWAAAHGFVHFVAAFSDSASQAETHLATFKAELDGNPLIREDFPDLVQPATSSRGAVKADRQSQIQMANGFTFAARGIDSGNLGLKVGRQRPDVLIADDIESGEANYSVHQAAKRLSTLQNVILPLSEFARCVVVGTTTMAEGLIHQCVKSVITTEKPAEWIKEEKFDVHYYEPIIQTDIGERSIWPAKWPMAYMATVRATRSFKLNFLNQPSSANADYWTEDDFTYGRFPVARKYLSVDGAVTTKKKSDFTALSVVGLAPARPATDKDRAVPARCLVEHAEAIKLKGAALRERALQILDAYPEIGAILVESNQGGDLWHEVFHHMPVKVVTFSNSEPKEVRAGRLLNLYQLLPPRVVHAEPLPALEEQMCAFPKGLNDDLIDSVGNGVLRFLRPPKKKGPPSASRASYV